MTSPAGKF